MIKVNTNISALKAAISLTSTQRSLDQTLERIASGVRINSAADDAAGLAISSAIESIVSRAAHAMVAQANQQPQAVHHLLGRELSKSIRSEHNLYS